MGTREAATMHAWRSRRGPLSAAELAETAVLADLTLVLSVASQILPFGGALLVVAVVPMAAVAARNRLRAVIVGTVAASTVGFLVLGTPVVTSVVACGALGAVVGYAARRGFGLGRTIGFAAAALWPLAATGIDVGLFVFSAYRKLVLAQIHNGWSGLSRALHNLHVAPITAVANRGDDVVAQLLRAWWLTVPVGLLVVVVVAAALAQRITGPTLRRVRAAFAADASAAIDSADDRVVGRRRPGAVEPAPVPVVLSDVGYRYPGRDTDVLCDVSLEIGAKELVAIVGPNGSGKSTLARILAGRRPSTGTVTRPGPTGLGAIGGTAIVFQRPELQVLGVRVRDDVVWGLAEPSAVNVDALLAVSVWARSPTAKPRRCREESCSASRSRPRSRAGRNCSSRTSRLPWSTVPAAPNLSRCCADWSPKTRWPSCTSRTNGRKVRPRIVRSPSRLDTSFRPRHRRALRTCR